ncbi:HAD family phosphatase [Pseudoalteromonas luteoviolacea]|uniref:HAD family hydrolase n=1 Tax=Pseudoalteromonas luteoviolacea TaxID=43657 RepID=UPI001F41EB1D|nr:HAD family phosphatase [Pseudoalteromonas luteoviolacea]MCF6439509.1 HAD family phosphatase [Pseudoalteromonas luteoviolacea]
MAQCQIKNVVFDIGNVVVRWSPAEIIRLTFPDSQSQEQLVQSVFGSNIWLDINKGMLSEYETKQKYQQALGFSAQDTERLFYYIKQTQILLYQATDLILQVKQAGYGVYALTDNVHETVEFLKRTYDFWGLFDGEIVSADLGVLKPQSEIYRALLEQYQLVANETVFLDDMPHNVAGAKAVGMEAIQFESVEQARKALYALGLVF